nr:ATP synthase F0 subunit 8 [Niphona lateraliplagiata]
MPQMAPLSWLILFIFFLISFLLFNISNYFTFNYSTKKTKLDKIFMKYNWKW